MGLTVGVFDGAGVGVVEDEAERRVDALVVGSIVGTGRPVGLPGKADNTGRGEGEGTPRAGGLFGLAGTWKRPLVGVCVGTGGEGARTGAWDGRGEGAAWGTAVGRRGGLLVGMAVGLADTTLERRFVGEALAVITVGMREGWILRLRVGLQFKVEARARAGCVLERVRDEEGDG